MIVYVEYVIIDNMVIDTLILLLTKQLAKLNTTKNRLLFSSLFGTTIALISPLLPSIINLIVKPLVAILMVIVAFKIGSKRQFCGAICLFFLSTFLFGGACYGICEMLGIHIIIKNGLMYEYKFPIGLALLICSFVYFLAKNIINYCLNLQKQSKNLFHVEISSNKNNFVGTAFLDTGNCLLMNNKPITIINYKVFNKLYPNIPLEYVLLKKDMGLPNQKYFEVKSITQNAEKILTFEVDKITLQNKQVKNAIVGLSLGNFKKSTNSDVIISSKIIGE